MRFTKKSGYHYYCYGIKEKENKNGLKRQYGKPITKLGELEDIEDELGIDLATLLKALILNEEIFYKDSKGKINSTKNEISLHMDGDGLCLHIRNIGYFFVKDYGKKWSLTKEELENE